MGVTAPKIMFVVQGIFRSHTHYITQRKFSRVFSFRVWDHRVFKVKLIMYLVFLRPKLKHRCIHRGELLMARLI